MLTAFLEIKYSRNGDNSCNFFPLQKTTGPVFINNLRILSETLNLT